MNQWLLVVGISLICLVCAGAAWGARSTLEQWAWSLAPADSRYVPDPKDIDFYYPLPEVVPVTSNFGWRTHPIYGDRRLHSGIDLGAPEGMPALAAHSGWVKQAGWLSGYGNTVILEYADGKYQTLYAHLSEVLVKENDPVKARQVIGLVGSTGGVTGPHLHFELLRKTANDWVAVNPGSQIQAVEAYVTIKPSESKSPPPVATAPNPSPSSSLSSEPPASANAPIAPINSPPSPAETIAQSPDVTASSPDNIALDFDPPTQ
ncbi:M23 family metallopeptidase [Pantanalinema rosaneae CENA516]